MAVKKTAGIGKGAAGPGRPKGAQNKVNSDVKAMILQALHNAGGVEYLTARAEDNPKAFMALVGRVLPLSLANQDGGPLAGVVLVPMKAPTNDQ
jgi:hypothetical protein